MVKEAAELRGRGQRSVASKSAAENKLDNLCYTLEKTLNENKGTSTPRRTSRDPRGLIKRVERSVEKQDDGGIRSALSSVSRKRRTGWRAAMLQAAGPGPENSGPHPGDGAGPPPPDSRRARGGADKKGSRDRRRVRRDA